MHALDGKVAIVTGAGQGVGEGVALALADEGAAVVCAGRTSAKVERTARTIEERGGTALPVTCDVLESSDIAACVETTIERFGTVDILVNNAVQALVGRLLELDDDAFEECWRSGALATFRFMRACHPHLRDGGVIVNMASGTAVMPNLTAMGGYTSCKEAIRSLTRAAACEWGPDGIRVLAVMPLALSPAMAEYVENVPEGREHPVNTVPLRRIGDCLDDVGRAVAMLCRPEMQYLTGTTIPLDGGQTPMR